MTGFDIKSLLNFNPPTLDCDVCYALFQSERLMDSDAGKGQLEDFGHKLRCPSCKTSYTSDLLRKREEESEFDPYPNFYYDQDLHKHLSKGLLSKEDLLKQAQKLARLSKDSNVPPLSKLFWALNEARSFVHFTTYGISHQLIGVLKMTAMRVAVRGVVSGVGDSEVAELQDPCGEVAKASHRSRWNIKVYDSKTHWSEFPHQKLIIIDGLLAFKGSANLTLNGWRKAGKGKDILEVVTSIDQVIELNNKYFSPLFADAEENSKTIDLDGIPF